VAQKSKLLSQYNSLLFEPLCRSKLKIKYSHF